MIIDRNDNYYFRGIFIFLYALYIEIRFPVINDVKDDKSIFKYITRLR